MKKACNRIVDILSVAMLVLAAIAMIKGERFMLAHVLLTGLAATNVGMLAKDWLKEFHQSVKRRVLEQKFNAQKLAAIVNEYNLILDKKSQLSHKDRRKVERTIALLCVQGIIKVELP